MGESSPDKTFLNAVGPWIIAAVGAVIGWLPGGLTGGIGSALMSLLAVAGGVCGLIFSLMYKRYLGVLGAGAHAQGSPERKAYDALRKSLRGGNIAVRLYSDWLSKFLDAVDRFFGDAGKADQTLFPRAFGLKTPAPLWTAPAFDRCLLLALIYPIVTIFIIWAVSGHVGPAEAALGLNANITGWRRGLALGLLGCLFFLFFLYGRFVRAKRLMLGFVAVAGAVAIAGAFAVAGAGTFAFAVAGAGAFAVAGAGAFAVAVAGAFAYAFAVAGAFAYAFAVAGAGAVAGAFAVIVTVAILNDIAVQNQRQGIFLTLYLFATIIMCLGIVPLLSPLKTWILAGPLLLFLGLLTLINAPFDWASLGLTRALLRRGLELGGWWPYFLALVDALAAAVIIALLAVAMVIGVQAFDHLAEHSGGADARVLPLDKLFNGIEATPSAPEFWWVYALLLSTMIPSLINLTIGGTSLLRGVPGLPALLLRFMPASKAVPTFDRTWLALVLTVQVFVGAFLGIAAQAFLAIGLLFYLLPWMGLELLDTARAVAEFDLPMRVLQLWWGNP